MTLPSQSERGLDNGRPKTGSKFPTVLISVLALVVVAGGVWGVMQLNKPADGKSGKDAGKSNLSMDLNQPGSGSGSTGSPAGGTKVPQTGLGSLGSQGAGSPGTAGLSNPPSNTPANPSSTTGGSNAPSTTGSPSNTPGTTPGAIPPGNTPSTTPSTGGPGTPSTGNTPATNGPGVDSVTGKPTSTDVTKPSLNPNSAPINPSPNSANPTGVTPTNTLLPTGPTDELRAAMMDADRKKASGDLLGARAAYTKVILSTKATRSDQETARTAATAINEDLFFSNKVTAGDPMTETYAVQAGDNPSKIAKKNQLATDPELIESVNKVKPTSLKVGQKLKLIRGPFNVIVHKDDFRTDLFWGPPSDPDSWLYIKSFKCGLGASNSNTPVGDFIAKPGSKMRNPPWTNPQTGEKFAASDPKNPIGHRWIGIEGVGEYAKFKGFGLHGTIDPTSIGQQKSMGCIRFGDDDINFLYDVIADGVSAVKIQQ